MSLGKIFRSRAGKAAVGVVLAFNALSFASSAKLWNQVSAELQNHKQPLPPTAELLKAAALTPTISGVGAVLDGHHIDRVFDPEATPNDWLVNSVLAVSRPVVGYDNGALVGLGFMMADNAVSFPGSMAGAAAGIGWDKLTHKAPTLAPSNP